MKNRKQFPRLTLGIKFKRSLSKTNKQNNEKNRSSNAINATISPGERRS